VTRLKHKAMKGIAGVVLVVLILGGGVWFFTSKEKAPVVGLQSETVQREEAGQPSVVGSITDAMGLGEKMRCTYATGEDKDAVVSSVYVDGKKFKTTTEVGGMKTEALFDGETQYVWSSNSTQGMKMSQDCLASFRESFGESEDAAGNGGVAPQDYQETFGMAKNVPCEQIGGVDFSVPVGITFTDQCAMMEQSKKMMEQMKGLAPAGTYPGQ